MFRSIAELGRTMKVGIARDKRAFIHGAVGLDLGTWQIVR